MSVFRRPRPALAGGAGFAVLVVAGVAVHVTTTAPPVPPMPSMRMAASVEDTRSLEGLSGAFVAMRTRSVGRAKIASAADESPPLRRRYRGGDRFAGFDANPVKVVAEEPVSTFSIDVDTASYGFLRAKLRQGVLPR